MLISRGRICQRASTDSSTSETVDDVSPTIATRLVEAVGWITAGGVPTFGRAFACVMRSWTICRASYRSVPGSKSQVDDRQAGHRPGRDRVDPRHAVEEVLLDRHRDQLLDLLRRQSEGLRLDLHRGRLELGVDVHVRALQLDERHAEERDDAGHDDPPQPHRRTDQPGDHRYLRRQRRDSAGRGAPRPRTSRDLRGSRRY